MNTSKEQYLKKLRQLIRVLPEGERATLIDFYREIVEDKIENGETEEQAVAELGDVNALAQKILMENPNRKPRDVRRIVNIALASFCGIFIVAAVVIFILSFTSIKINSAALSGTQQQAGAGEEKSASIPVAEVNSIVIDAQDKEVTMKQNTGETVQITYFAEKTQTYSLTTENGELEFINCDPESEHFFHFFDFSKSRNHSLITVSVPKSFRGKVSITSSNGEISVKDMEHLSDLVCETSNAKIKLSNVQADTVDTKSSNGGIQLVRVKANRLGADTSNSAMVLTEVTSPEITLSTSNAGIRGSICGREEDYTVHTDTSNGSCSPASRRGGSKELTADTSNGEIKLTFIE